MTSHVGITCLLLGDSGQPHLLLWELGFGDNGGDLHNRVQEEEDTAVLKRGSDDGIFH